LKQLFGICKRRHIDVFTTLANPVRDALQALMEKNPKEGWAEATRLLLQTDIMTRNRFKSLVRLESSNHLGAGLLYHLPAELYLDWVRKDPSRRAFIVMRCFFLTTEAVYCSLALHPALEAFIAEFGDAEHVLEELSARFLPHSWCGSIV